MTRATWSHDASRVDLLSALHDTTRREPELCSLVRQRYVDSLYQAVEGVLAHAVERGELPPRQGDPSGGHPIAVSAALALLLHWGLVRDRQVGDDGIAAVVDAVLMPSLRRSCVQRHRQEIDQTRPGSVTVAASGPCGKGCRVGGAACRLRVSGGRLFPQGCRAAGEGLARRGRCGARSAAVPVCTPVSAPSWCPLRVRCPGARGRCGCPGRGLGRRAAGRRGPVRAGVCRPSWRRS
ncbi:hypothetical protein GJU35_44840 [Streptomyces lincolnensis]|nr:hypothetical protein GJU35_00080 [Streptomyces lincolnensis]QMV12065.1 hypothetical protein GJU35_44840 [Streptomyces lincolnensis]